MQIEKEERMRYLIKAFPELNEFNIRLIEQLDCVGRGMAVAIRIWKAQETEIRQIS